METCKGLVFSGSKEDDFLPSHLSLSSGGEERAPGTDAQNTLQQQRRKQETLGAVVQQSDSGLLESENCHLSFSRTLVYFPVPTENSFFRIISDAAVNILIFHFTMIPSMPKNPEIN